MTTTDLQESFDQADVEAKINGLFNSNRTLSSFTGYETSDLTIIASFTNKNSDGSAQKTRATFSGKKALDAAKTYLDQKVARHREIDRTPDVGIAAQAGKSSTQRLIPIDL